MNISHYAQVGILANHVLTFRKTPSVVAFPWFETVTLKMPELKLTASTSDFVFFAHYSGISIVPAGLNVPFE